MFSSSKFNWSMILNAFSHHFSSCAQVVHVENGGNVLHKVFFVRESIDTCRVPLNDTNCKMNSNTRTAK